VYHALTATRGAVFKRFTEEARTVVIRAKDNARLRNHVAIDERHFLLALIEAADNTAAIILMTLGYDCGEIGRAVEGSMHCNEGPSRHRDLSFTPSAKAFLEQSAKEAERLGVSEIGCEHFLLSLLHPRRERTTTDRILARFGITFELVDERLAELTQLLEFQ
jgi:ATP-dependent Clp protease ATP-binding subunit ClpC